jgi:hypothetical protein
LKPTRRLVLLPLLAVGKAELTKVSASGNTVIAALDPADAEPDASANRRPPAAVNQKSRVKQTLQRWRAIDRLQVETRSGVRSTAAAVVASRASQIHYSFVSSVPSYRR